MSFYFDKPVSIPQDFIMIFTNIVLLQFLRLQWDVIVVCENIRVFALNLKF